MFLESRHVRFGSKADMCSAKRHVRFTPESGHGSGIPNNKTFGPARVGHGRTPKIPLPNGGRCDAGGDHGGACDAKANSIWRLVG